MIRPFLCLLALGLTAGAATKPNVVVILCDDLGYGDVKCLNPDGKIATPNIDRLASQGLIFTDAHTPSAVCTPTRYGLMTGRYSWRTRLQNGVLGGLSPRLIEEGRTTLASLLQEHGYATACVGKWHLGMDWKVLPGKEVSPLSIEKPEQVHSVDYTAPIKNGPTSVGFDYYYGISASLDMVPYAFIENDRVTEAPTGETSYPMVHGREKDATRKGPQAPGFSGYDVLPTLTRKAVEYIDQQAPKAKAGQPFFLYLPLASPHTPILPTAEWQGKSGLNPYADFVMQTDASVGQIMAALERGGVSKDTLVIFTSDNGCSPKADFPELAAKGHNPSGRFRGNKADIYEGGHRVPFIVSWPGHTAAGRVSSRLTCLTDVLATVAAVTGAKVSETTGEDSVSFAAELGDRGGTRESAVVHHSVNGSFAIRDGQWKLVLCSGSGGWSAPRPNSPEAKQAPRVQLYDLSQDIGETRNVQASHPEVVDRLTKLMEKYVADGRSTPGTPQPNAVPIELWKDKTLPTPKKAK